GIATDANDDELTYIWEQFDRGPATPLGSPTDNAPLFRTFRPTINGNVRYFPSYPDILRNRDNLTEPLPTYSRDLTFRLVARDNNPEAGGVDWKQLHFFAEGTAGPFLVDNPAESEWFVGDFREVTWDVANTNVAPVNCQRVNILLSTNGGDSFDVVLLENVANTGSAFVTVPAAALTSEARIMVEAADNIFLNVNTTEFDVLPAVEPTYTLEPEIRYSEVCLPDVLTIDFNSSSILDFTTPIALSIEDTGFPEGTLTSLSSENLTPGETSTLTIDLSEVRFSGNLAFSIAVAVEGRDTTRREIVLNITDNDYSDLAAVLPAEGTTGINLTTDFDWTEAINADDYEFELATSATFAENTIVERATGLAITEYTPTDFLENNTLFFWRVRGTNNCGPGVWAPTSSFRTNNIACEEYTYDGNPVGLPGSGPSFVRESTIFIEEVGTISEVKVPNVNVQYNFASKVKLTLVSPAGTRVVLYDEKCFSTNKVDLGFDDNAPVAVECPPDDRRVFIPEESLAAFVGEQTLGEWILEVAVSETGGSAGSIQGWQVEFCADVASVAPQAINNNATEVPPLERNVIVKDKLSVSSPAFPNELVQYTITDLPDAGRLLLYGVELMQGDTFQQDDINGLGLFYENTDGSFDTDDFGFLVTTPDGGYLPIMYHDIIISEDAVTSNRTISPIDAGLTAFPNPVGDVLSIRWELAVNRQLALELFDLNGRLLQQKMVAGATKAAALNLIDLPNG
ncbi:MAG: proprotein convertase P-domain-containing protein, partial [Bacteroidota bacterium]